MSTQKMILSLVLFSLMGCNYSSKKNIIIIPQYTMPIEESRALLQDDFVKKAVNNRVYFGFDKATLSNDAKDILKKQAKWLNDNPLVSALIEGHCDEIGTKEHNFALGLRRANAANKFLIAQGIDKTRLNVISHGKERPQFLEHNIESHKLNRRSVTIIVTSQGDQ